MYDITCFRAWDIGAITIPPDIEPVGICLSGVIERVQIGHRSSGQDSLVLALKSVPPHRIGGEETVLLAQKEPVCLQFAPDQFRCYLLSEDSKALRISGGQVDIYRAMDQRLSVLSHSCDKLRHILKVALGSDGLFHIVGTAPSHAVFILGVVKDAVFLCCGYLSGVDAQGNAALFS